MKSQAKQDTTKTILVTPAARKLARIYKIKISEVKGSGPFGIITEEDLKEIAKSLKPVRVDRRFMRLSEEKKKVVREMLMKWEEKLKEVKRGRDPSIAFLELCYHDMMTSAKFIDCPYCRKHMILEAEEISRVIELLETQGNSKHKHGIKERIKSLYNAAKITYYIILGGLHRAGII